MEARPSAPAPQTSPHPAPVAEAPVPAAANGEGGGDFDALLALLLAVDGTPQAEAESAEAGQTTAGEPGKGEAAVGRPLPPSLPGARPESEVAMASGSVAMAEGGSPMPISPEAEPLPDLPFPPASSPGEVEGRSEDGVSQVAPSAAPAPGSEAESLPDTPQARPETPVDPSPDPPRTNTLEVHAFFQEGMAFQVEESETLLPMRETAAPRPDARETVSIPAATVMAEAREVRPTDPGRAALPKEAGEGDRDDPIADDSGQGNPSPDPDPRQEASRLVTRFQQLQERLAAMAPEPRTDTAPDVSDPAGDPALDPIQDLNRELTQGSESRPLRLNLPTPVQDPRWGRDFSERILWLTRNDQSAAELRLNPRHLGPIQVRIQLDDDQATLHIQAHHAATREAVEAALPRLRESLAEAGIQLAQAQVGGQGAFAGDPGRGGGSQPDQSTARHGPTPEPPNGEPAPPTRILVSDGLLDTFV